MSNGLGPPKVIGDIPPAVFSSVYSESARVVEDFEVDEEIYNLPDRVLPIFQHIASLSGYELEEAHSGFVCSSRVQPGKPQRDEVAAWHTDDGLMLNVVSTIPTDYLVATSDVVRLMFGEEYLPLDHPSSVERLASAVNAVDDNRLLAAGFSLWRPKPYQVVELDGSHLHRAGVNRTAKSVHQIFASLLLAI